MALRDEYDSIRSSMLHTSPLPSVESAFSELLAKETRRLTRGPFSSSLGGIDTVFATTSHKSSASSEGKPSTTRDMSKVKCNYCKEFGHMKFTCPKLKKSPHSTSSRRTIAASAAQDDSLPSQPSTSPNPIPTFGDIQEMINKALIGLVQGSSSASALSASSGTGPVNEEDHERDKLSAKFAMCVFLGYGIEQKGFRCFDPVANKLRISRHVTFWEHVPFYSLPKNSDQSSMSPIVVIDIFPDGSSPLLSASSDSVAGSPFDDTLSPSPPTVDVLVPSSASLSEPIPPLAPEVPPSAPRQSSRIRRPSVRLNDYRSFFSALTSVYEPSAYREASSDPLWQQAMAEELQALDKAHTWDLVSLPPGKSPICCKWVYKVKTKADGSIDRYKARLVAKAYNQEYDIDYEETFAPVARLTSVRVLLVIATIRHWDFFQMNVKNAFLNGALIEEVYMVPPSGSSHPSGQVCRLRRALYGLKQAPRAWFSTFSSKVVKFGYTQSRHDSALFIRQSSSGTVLLLLYVDDMMITGDHIQGIYDPKRYLSSCFEMKDLGQLRYFLALKFFRLMMVMAFLWLIMPLTCLIEVVCLMARQLVGGLLYLTISRPDISYAVHVDGIDHVLDKAVASPPEGAEESVKVANDKLVLEDKKARSIMVTFMEPDVEILFEDQLIAHAMFKAVGASLGHPIPDELQVETIINNLPPSWDSAVVSLNMSDVALTVQTLTAKLTIEAQRRKKKSTTDSMLNIASGAEALTSKPKNIPPKKQDFKKQGKKPQFKGNNFG
ncbi:hypothetical protein H6P81_016175 [Aristolochia fimbriata]|uniref:Reverse transcriptase Ty1/copia-type domain-containing protein n=1 Tax=Aristolochia fimbriata TaxID=158543 RepID=A0AAV7E9M7_ARIFI|nr:hypothetical protein H6P81_016175 [Aristolochia fimbriata]